MALVLAGIVAIATLAWAILLDAANGSRPIPKRYTGSVPTLVVGLSCAGLIAWSHWWTIHW